MPLSKKEKEIIIRIGKKYGVKRLWLFGSTLDPSPKTEPNDIDLAVEGVRPELFYRFYGDLLMELPRPVDLVDMKDGLPVVDDVKEKGVIILAENRRPGKTEKGNKTGKAAYR